MFEPLAVGRLPNLTLDGPCINRKPSRLIDNYFNEFVDLGSSMLPMVRNGCGKGHESN